MRRWAKSAIQQDLSIGGTTFFQAQMQGVGKVSAGAVNLHVRHVLASIAVRAVQGNRSAVSRLASAKNTAYLSRTLWRVGGVVTQRIANPCTPVRFRYSPPMTVPCPLTGLPASGREPSLPGESNALAKGKGLHPASAGGSGQDGAGSDVRDLLGKGFSSPDARSALDKPTEVKRALA